MQRVVVIAAVLVCLLVAVNAHQSKACCAEINKPYVNHANSLGAFRDPLYTQAVEAGRLIFLSSQTGNPGDNPYPDAWDCSVYNQTKVALQNFEYALAALGMNRENLLKIDVWAYPNIDYQIILSAFEDFFAGVERKPVVVYTKVTGVILFSPYKVQLDAYAYNQATDIDDCEIPITTVVEDKITNFGSFPSAVRTGAFIHTTGISGKIDGKDAADQAARAFKNLEKVLAGVGASKKDLIEVKLFLSDIALLPKVDQAYKAFVAGISPLPVRSVLGGVLTIDGSDILLEATAYVRDDECAEKVKGIVVPEILSEPLASQGVQVGNFIFVGAAYGNLANTTHAFRYDPESKNRSMDWEFYQALYNAEKVLARAGADRTDMLWTYNYLADLMLFADVNKGTLRFFEDTIAPVPGRVDTGSLPLPYNALVSVYVVGYRQKRFTNIASKYKRDWNTLGAVPGTPAAECFY